MPVVAQKKAGCINLEIDYINKGMPELLNNSDSSGKFVY